MAEYKNNNGTLAWDAVIDDGEQFLLLEEGNYIFTVADFKRGEFPGSAKLPAGAKAELVLEVKTEMGVSKIKTNLILHDKTVFKVAAFFRSIGLKKRGEPVQMKWNEVLGKTGRAHIVQRDYVGSDKRDHCTNDIDYYIDPEVECDIINSPQKNDASFIEYKEVPDEELPF